MLTDVKENEGVNASIKGFPEQGDVLLMVSPLFWRELPSLSLHLLQVVCRQGGIITRVLYLNFLYSLFIGHTLHSKISHERNLLLDERLFAPVAFNRSAAAGCIDKLSDGHWIPDHSAGVPGVTEPSRDWIAAVDWEHLETLTTRWIQATARRIANMKYSIVGCTTTPGGLVPAVALLGNIKKENPDITTVIGGALCEQEMAQGILSLKSGIDYVFSGEGDLTFPDFARNLLAGLLPGEKIIYGETIKKLDTIPPPDYQDYFEQREMFSSPDHPFPGGIEIPYETSRGCWYGKCTFCGLYGGKNFYREKSTDKILDDLNTLSARHGNHTIFMADPIMPPHFFNTLLPRISEKMSHINIRYEIKANLTLEQVLSLKKAGVISIEPGIESLSPSLLRRMRKGVTVREIIALLRYARSANLQLFWNILFGFPGEGAGEYEEMLQLLPLIRHLPPPRILMPLLIYRFSPYQTSPEAFGISNLRPAGVYKDIFPAHADLEKIAFYFSSDHQRQSQKNPAIIAALAEEFRAWKQAWQAYRTIPLEMILPTLHITGRSEDEYVLEDTRGLRGRPVRRVLDREQARILLVASPHHSSADYRWAVDNQLGVLMDSWYIPLATADPELLLQLEQDYGKYKGTNKQ